MEAMNLFRAYRQTPLERFPRSSSSWPTESNGTESGCDSGGFLLLEGSSPLGQSISALLRLPHHKWRSRGAGGQAICKLRQSQSHFIFRTFVLARWIGWDFGCCEPKLVYGSSSLSAWLPLVVGYLLALTPHRGGDRRKYHNSAKIDTPAMLRCIASVYWPRPVRQHLNLELRRIVSSPLPPPLQFQFHSPRISITQRRQKKVGVGVSQQFGPLVTGQALRSCPRSDSKWPRLELLFFSIELH